MTDLDVSCRFLNQIKNAASQCAAGEPQPMIDMMEQIQKESFLEGFNYAIEILQEVKNNEFNR